jgi:hypothetical protein
MDSLPLRMELAIAYGEKITILADFQRKSIVEIALLKVLGRSQLLQGQRRVDSDMIWANTNESSIAIMQLAHVDSKSLW